MTCTAAVVGVFSAAIAVGGMCGWLLNITALKSILPDLATMKFNTAIAVFLCGMGLFFKASRSNRGRRNGFGSLLAACGAIVGLATLAEYWFGMNLRIDQLFVHDLNSVTSDPGRMSIATALCAVLTGTSIALLDLANPLGQVMAIASATVAGLGLIGYAYGISSLYHFFPYRTMALHTAASFFILSIGQLMARPHRSAHRLLVSNSAGGSLARRMLPITILMPLILGAVCLHGFRLGLYDSSVGFAIFGLLCILILAVSVWWNASLLDRADLGRQQLESDRADLLIRERGARERAERASHAKDQLLSVVSHELRTPLTPVLLTATVLEARHQHQPELCEDLRMIREQVEIEKRLVDDLLDLASLSQNRMQLQCERLDMHEAIRRAVAAFRRLFKAKDVDLAVELDAEEPMVDADPARIHQILQNLLGNSLKFTPAGGRVSLRTSDLTGRRFCIELADNGVGIELAAMDRIFGPFEQGDSSTTREFGGMGIGLTICKTLVELHGGTLHGESGGAGAGAVFRVELPAAVGQAHAAPRLEPPNEGTCETSAGVSILLVEDNADSLRAMSRVIRALGHSVVAVNSAQRALDESAENEFDLLISDIGLPDVSGWELMRRLRQQRPELRAIALSGFVAEEDRRKSLAVGFACHLSKPIDVPRLSQAIQAATAGAARQVAV